jgi:hypothetical protein
MDVPFDEQPLVPIRVRVLLGKKRRKQIDEPLAMLLAKFPLDLYLSTVAIIVGELRGPGIDDDRQRNAV